MREFASPRPAKPQYRGYSAFGMLVLVAFGALWDGGENRLGKTFWQSVDAGVISGVAATALKYAFSRERPSQTSDLRA